MKKTIKIQGKPYHLYDSFNSFAETSKVIKKIKRKNKAKHFIIKEDNYAMFGNPFIYHLFLSKKIRI